MVGSATEPSIRNDHTAHYASVRHSQPLEQVEQEETIVAHILIATANMKAQRALTEVLAAVGHHVITTTEPGLGLAIPRLSQHPLIVLLGEEHATPTGLGEPGEHSLLGLLLDDDADPAQDVPWLRRPQHCYILLTHTPPHESTAPVRALLEGGAASSLPCDCSIGALLNAIEDASERLAQQREVHLALAASIR